MIDSLTAKRQVLLLVMAGAVVVLVSGSREWVSGSTADVVLGASVLHGRGADVAPVAMAAALVGLAAAVAVGTAGPVVRVVAATAALLAAALCAGVIVGILVDPSGALGTLAAAGTGRSGTVAASGRAGIWVWVALAAALAMGVGALGAMVGSRRWRGLSDRFDSPIAGDGAQRHPAAASPSGPESAWDQLSRGKDPTDEQ
ncbi:MAG: Trp biosynthesis-associated membrane protein [Dermatophilaceae bacterium]